MMEDGRTLMRERYRIFITAFRISKLAEPVQGIRKFNTGGIHAKPRQYGFVNPSRLLELSLFQERSRLRYFIVNVFARLWCCLDSVNIRASQQNKPGCDGADQHRNYSKYIAEAPRNAGWLQAAAERCYRECLSRRHYGVTATGFTVPVAVSPCIPSI